MGVLAGLLLVAALAAAACLAAANPRGAWETPKNVRAVLAAKGLVVLECRAKAACPISAARLGKGWVGVPVRLLSATVRGTGPTKAAAGGTRYQTFDVSFCARDLVGKKVSARMHWYTRRPPKVVKTVGGASYDAGVAHGTDWQYDKYMPVARAGC